MPQRSQTFDSAGPDVRIRGNAYQVLEKYLAMARDASAAGDRIAAENFYQHAEHYYRVISANGEHNRHQQQQQHHQHPQQMHHGHHQGQPQQGYGQGQPQQGHGQHGHDPRNQPYGGGQPYDAQHQNGGGYGNGPQPVVQQHPQQHGQNAEPGGDPNGPDRRRE
jgi:Domain of unknown function (DUF4167)